MFNSRGWTLKSSNQSLIFPHILPILLLNILKTYCVNQFYANVTKHMAETVDRRRDLFQLMISEGFQSSWGRYSKVVHSGTGWCEGQWLFTPWQNRKQRGRVGTKGHIRVPLFTPSVSEAPLSKDAIALPNSFTNQRRGIQKKSVWRCCRFKPYHVPKLQNFQEKT